MRLNRAAHSVETRQKPVRDAPLVPKAMALDWDIVELGAKALFAYVFSSCDRLDGKYHWEDSDEHTKDGFRGEALAVIGAVWPKLLCREARPVARTFAKLSISNAPTDRSA
jgi:hypothetical protein